MQMNEAMFMAGLYKLEPDDAKALVSFEGTLPKFY